MNYGTLGERYVEASLLPKIRNVNKETEQGPGIGNDFSSVSGIISATGVGLTPETAFFKCFNNILCSGCEVVGMQIVMNLPKTVKDSQIKKYMDEFSYLSSKYSVGIIGGHTQIGDSDKALFNVFMVGKERRFSFSRKMIQTGSHIVMINRAGAFGTKNIIESKREVLSERFDGMYLENALQDSFNFCVYNAIKTLLDSDRLIEDIYYIHDASFGGVYASLWQLGKWSGRGFLTDNRKIPIRQETIEVCEFFDINPYCIDSTGVLLLICGNGHDIVKKIKSANMEAAVIGTITDDNERIVKLSESDFRRLSPVVEDEMFKI